MGAVDYLGIRYYSQTIEIIIWKSQNGQSKIFRVLEITFMRLAYKIYLNVFFFFLSNSYLVMVRVESYAENNSESGVPTSK